MSAEQQHMLPNLQKKDHNNAICPAHAYIIMYVEILAASYRKVEERILKRILSPPSCIYLVKIYYLPNLFFLPIVADKPKLTFDVVVGIQNVATTISL